MSKAKILLASVVWLVILTIGVGLYRLWYVPQAEKQAEKQAEQQQEALVEATSGNSKYEHRLRLGLDAFSGYAILRSSQMTQELASRGIKIDFADDGADYKQRLSRLASGELQLAAFPIDALLKAGEQLKAVPLPVTIVAIIDETRGADAILAYKRKFPKLDALNRGDTRFVLVGNSPSETLVRVLMHDFQMDAIDQQALVMLDTEQQVLARYRQATPEGPEVFVTWEPNVSEMLSNPEMHVLLDSSRQSGYIVDTLVVSRDYLAKNEPVVREVLESYFRALHTINNAGDDRQGALKQTIVADAEANGAELSLEQASRLVEGIVWRNTQENFAHFGLRSGGVTYVEDMIDRIRRVLMQTGGLRQDPTQGDATTLFFERPLRQLQESGFHPGVSPESIRSEAEIRRLAEGEWERLVPIGTLNVPPLPFARGRAHLIGSSRAKLDDLAETLKSWPMGYLLIRGNAGSRGDPELNRSLAKQRAEAALQYLIEKGVAAQRMRVVDGELTGEMSVTFVLGQPPY